MAKILVIDDEPSVTASLEQALRTAGHRVMQAANGLEGTKQQAAEPADLVITDMFMPDQDGVQTLMQFRKLFPGVPIIAMSGNPKGDMLTVAQKLGAVAVLEKPFSRDELLSAVEKALKRG
jgi:DNA-binding NtrC family response regulator